MTSTEPTATDHALADAIGVAHDVVDVTELVAGDRYIARERLSTASADPIVYGTQGIVGVPSGEAFDREFVRTRRVIRLLGPVPDDAPTRLLRQMTPLDAPDRIALAHRDRKHRDHLEAARDALTAGVTTRELILAVIMAQQGLALPGVEQRDLAAALAERIES
jgi:hypothetical protein